MELTRRDLFKSAAVAGGAAAVAGLAGAAYAAEEQGATSPSKYPVKRTALTCDVLVIGAGCAGTEAATEAAATGASVIILDKKLFGHCGDSGLHFSGRMTSSDFGIDGDNVDVHLENSVEVGRYIVDQELGRQVLQGYADDRVVMKSENYGNLHFRSPETGEPLITPSRNKPRCWNGYKLYNVAYKAIENGAKIMDRCTATMLLDDGNGTITGATAVDFLTGEFYIIRAKSVILATGGDQGLWGAGTVAALHSGGVEAQTGDGHALAAPYGVEFRDLEFRSVMSIFGPVMPSAISSFLGVYSSNFAAMTDVNGDPAFPALVDAGPWPPARLSITELKRLEMEGRLGPNGGVFGPCASNEAYDDCPWNGFGGDGGSVRNIGYSAECWHQAMAAWDRNGADFGHMELSDVHCYDYGGIVTDIDAWTGVDGLYAAGECAMHCGAGYGTFRMFSSGMVMGKRAALAAVKRAGEVEFGPFDADKVEAEIDRVYGYLFETPEGGVRAYELKHRIQDSAWKGSGSLRSETKCNEALAELADEEALLPLVYVADKNPVCNLEWMESLSLGNMIKMARMDTIAGLTRTESRGSHMRNEYPEEDNDNWIKNVYIREVDGQVQVDVRDAVIVDIPVPDGKIDQGGGIIEGY